MSQEAARLYGGDVEEDGLVVFDSTIVDQIPDTPARVFSVPITRLAKEVGNPLTANIVAIGALASAARLVTYESMLEAIRLRLPKVSKINEKALEVGWEQGRLWDR